MKRKKTISNLVSVVVLLIFVALATQTARAVQVPFYDSFDKYELGVDKHQPPWQTLCGLISAEVCNYVTNPNQWWPRSDDQSLLLEGDDTWPRMDYVKLDSMPNVLSYEASVYLVSGDIRVGFMEASGPIRDMDNFFQFGNTGLITWVGEDLGITLGVWSPWDIYRVRADIDGPSQTADVYLFNVITGGWTYKLDVPACWPRDPETRFLFDNFGVSTGGLDAYSFAYFDDVLLTPEPATVLLLGLGGLALLRRKHSYGA